MTSNSSVGRWTSYLTYPECSLCGRRFAADELHPLCPNCARLLLARYDLAAVSGPGIENL